MTSPLMIMVLIQTQEATKESTLWGYLMMENSKMLRSSMRVTFPMGMLKVQMLVHTPERHRKNWKGKERCWLKDILCKEHMIC